MRNIRGCKLRQRYLESNLSNVNAGQSTLVKLACLFLTLLFCFLVNISTGYLGGISAFNIGVKSVYGLSYLSTLLILLCWFITVIFNNFIKSLIVICFIFFVTTLGFVLLGSFGILEIPSAYLILTFFLTLFGLFAFGSSLFSIRFTLALVDILFAKCKFLKGVIIFSAVFPALIGANFGVTLLKIAQSDEGLWSAIRALNETQLNKLTVSSVITGSIFGPAIAIGAWWANLLRDVPWKYPELLREWALATGSLGGTSFYNLDLSGVNFRNASLANTDLRAKKLYRTCFQGVKGLERARVDSRYMDLELLKVQKLLTHGCCEDEDFSLVSLRGAYLQGADLRGINFTDTDLIGADLENADLRNANLARAQVIDVNFTSANLTGICIADWSINDQTKFTNVHCDYVYRKLDENGNPTDRFPADRNFEPREFESLYQEVENVVELIFKEGINWRAVAFTLQKLQLEDEGLGLELRGIEKRGDLWVVKVSHNEATSSTEVERRLYPQIEEMKQLLATKEHQINKLLGIASDQAESLKELSKKPFGNNFSVTDSIVTNLSGGEIRYAEAAGQIRSLVTQSSEVQAVHESQRVLTQLQNVAPTPQMQAELIQQILLKEAQTDPSFKHFLLQQQQQILSALPPGTIASAIQRAIAQLDSEEGDNVI